MGSRRCGVGRLIGGERSALAGGVGGLNESICVTGCRGTCAARTKTGLTTKTSGTAVRLGYDNGSEIALLCVTPTYSYEISAPLRNPSQPTLRSKYQNLGKWPDI